MGTTQETYNGWANWETWNVHLWITNEEASYGYWHDRSEELLSEDHEEAVEGLAARLREEVPHRGDVGDDVSWHRVDWREIAEALLER